ncbi:hypothetical protein KFK09_021010 [Dendrobium nobile]|uniref:Uncharacterized protein n=1 Tax=Dendrobium nobile TaxID=94219 RepID=A0A8T3AUM2_DENNO|nr:hypothetical protein KFK09_021010 [Dendrobium nobile]
MLLRRLICYLNFCMTMILLRYMYIMLWHFSTRTKEKGRHGIIPSVDSNMLCKMLCIFGAIILFSSVGRNLTISLLGIILGATALNFGKASKHLFPV